MNATRVTNPADTRVSHLSADATRPRDRTRETAQRLSLLATRNWEKALTGVLALPAAAALTTGATALFAVSVLERTFELLDSALADVGRRVGEGPQGDPRWNEAASSANVAARGSNAPAPTVPGVVVARSEGAVTASAPPVGDVPGAPVRVRRRARAEADDSWDVVLVEAGANPIALIRELRELTGKELRDLETLVGSVPETVKSAVTRADAESLRERIEASGGRVEVRRGS